MKLAIVVVLAACGAAPVRQRTCTDDAWVVVHAKQNCEDLRGGISGYWVFEIVDGSQRGKTVIGRYRDAPKNEHNIGLAVSNWGIARIRLAETAGVSSWDNLCVKFGPSAPLHVGTISELRGFDREADARRAWAAQPCEAKLAAAVRRPSCEGTGWQLLRAQYRCSDIRSGISGYWRLEVIGGPHAGKTVVAQYGDRAVAQVGNWNLSRTVTFAPTTPGDVHIDNDCTPAPPAKGETYDGIVDVSAPGNVEAFEDEAAARAALAKKCQR